MKEFIRQKRALVICLSLAFIILIVLFAKEGTFNRNDKEEEKEILEIGFDNIASIEDVENLDGKRVKIYGYISPASPYQENTYTYLTKTPYLADVFSKNSYDTIAVYVKDTVEYTSNLVYVIGDFVKGDIKDSQGYSYKYAIKNAEVKIVDENDIEEELLKKYVRLASDNVLEDLNEIFSYIDMLIYFEDYKNEGYMHEDDLNIISIDKIDVLTEKVKAYNEENYSLIIEVLDELKEVANKLNKLLDSKKYSDFVKYKEDFENAYYKFYYYIQSFSI